MGDDKIIDLCRPADPQTPAPAAETQTLRSGRPVSLDFTPLTPNTRWIMYRSRIRFEIESGTAEMRPLPT